ncbi:MAG: hypothetical protein A2V59_11910 [Armatimonadetes bacterium RBG_19FT_COMBO_69_19]|nr:MAG: hypothetical protein A2V59_11910 [Armatimonadetes bacterium RBG_19FT_COMBO_69_19]
MCEQCGADLSRRENLTPSSPLPASRRAGEAVAVSLRAIVAVPVRLVRGAVAALQALLSLIIGIIVLTVRAVLVLVVLGALVIGLSYVPAVQAKVPVAKELPRMTVNLLRRGADLGGRLLRTLRQETEAPLEASRPAATAPKPSAPKSAAPKPAASKPAAVALSLTVRSSPQGATVLLNQRRMGKTPLAVKVAPGTYRVTISRSGYKSVTRTVIIKAGQPASIDITLTIAP